MKKTLQTRLTSFAIVALAFLGIVSCKKEMSNGSGTTRNLNLRSLSREIPFNDWPTLSNGMLCFRDDAHYLAYDQYLDTVIGFSENHTDTGLNDPDDILEVVESGLNFTSLRHTTAANFATLNETGWSSVEEIPKRHFLNSLTSQSILNANADFRVADTITHFVNADFAVDIPATETALLEQLHSLPESATFEDIQSLDLTGDVLRIVRLRTHDLGVGQVLKTTAAVIIRGPDVISPDPCAFPNRIELSSLWMNPVNTGGGPVKGDYRVEWGDGTFTNVTSAGVSSSPYFSPKITHDYPAQGTYNVFIYGKTNTGTPSYVALWDGTVSKTIIVSVPCTPGESKTQGSPWQYDNQGMNRALWGQVWVEQDLRPGKDKHKVGVKTESYHKTSGKWRLSRIDQVVAQASTTKYQGSCTIQWGDNPADWANNSRTAYREHKNSGVVK